MLLFVPITQAFWPVCVRDQLFQNHWQSLYSPKARPSSWPAMHCAAFLWKLFQMNPSVYLHFCAESPGNMKWSCCVPSHMHCLRNHSHWGMKSQHKIPELPSSLEEALWVYFVRVIWKLRAKHNHFLFLTDAQHSAAELSNISCYLDSSSIT